MYLNKSSITNYLVSSQYFEIKSEILAVVNTFFPQIDPKFYFRNNRKIGYFFTITDKVGMFLRSCVVYIYIGYIYVYFLLGSIIFRHLFCITGDRPKWI